MNTMYFSGSNNIQSNSKMNQCVSEYERIPRLMRVHFVKIEKTPKSAYCSSSMSFNNSNDEG